MRVAVVDIGTNSTRLLIADVDGHVREIERRSIVTRLGRGVDTSGRLAAEAIEEVCNAVGDYLALSERAGAERVRAIATSAVRDAGNREMFLAELRERFALDAEILDGATEARLTYVGAYAERPPASKTMVVDIGGGSTELVIGDGPEVGFSASLQAGTVRHTERHLKHDPPETLELEALAADIGALISEALEGEALAQANFGIGVAGTPTSLAAIEQRLDPYDPELVHGYRLSIGSIQRMLSMLGGDAARRAARGPGAAPGPGADDRRRGGDPDRGHARLRARRDRGLRARHPLGRGARCRGLRRSRSADPGDRDRARGGEVAEGGLRAQVLVQDPEPGLASRERGLLDEAVDDRDLDPADAAEHLAASRRSHPPTPPG